MAKARSTTIGETLVLIHSNWRLQFQQPDGFRLLALVNVFPIRDHSDEVIGAVNIFRHNTSKTVPGLNA